MGGVAGEREIQRQMLKALNQGFFGLMPKGGQDFNLMTERSAQQTGQIGKKFIRRIRKGIASEGPHGNVMHPVGRAPDGRRRKQQDITGWQKHLFIWPVGRWHSHTRDTPVIAVQSSYRQRQYHRRLHARVGETLNKALQCLAFFRLPGQALFHIERYNIMLVSQLRE